MREQNRERVHAAAGVHIRREARLAQQPDNAPEEAEAENEEAESEVSPESSTDGYPIAEQHPSESEPLRRSVGLSKAVQYRLLQNRRPIQSQPMRYRQAAAFGATQRLVKHDYQVTVEDHCAPTRTNLYCRLHFSR